MRTQFCQQKDINHVQNCLQYKLLHCLAEERRTFSHKQIGVQKAVSKACTHISVNLWSQKTK